MLKIGTTVLRHGILLGPMAGVADSAFRTICARMGAEFAVTEMVSAKAVFYGDKKTLEIADIRGSEIPTAVQLFGSDPRIMAFAAGKAVSGEITGGVLPAAVDINCGCPVKKIVSNGEGSALMKEPELIGEIVSAVRREIRSYSDIPVTVKIRAGWDGNSINAPEVAIICEQAGAAAVTVHGRTREQMYSGRASLDVIGNVKKAVSIPVIGNGDIFSAEDAVRMTAETGCDGIMVARGSLGNPFIFSEISLKMEGKDYSSPSPDEIISKAKEHLSLAIREKGEKTAMLQARKHLSWYIKGMRGSASARDAINRSESFDDVVRILDSFISDSSTGG